jgi:thioredoxin 1
LAEDRELERIKERMLKRLTAPHDSGPWVDGVVTELSAKNFNEALARTSRPVLVDFWAGWCAPCMIMKPVMEALAKEYSGRAHFAKVDVDRNRALAQRYGVMSLPNFVVFKNGRPVDRAIGSVGRPVLEGLLAKYL